MTDTKFDMSKLTMPAADAAKFAFTQPPNNIIFFNTLGDKQVEVLRISKDGITTNPDVPVDEAAAAVIRALDGHIQNLVNRKWAGLREEDFVLVNQLCTTPIQAAEFVDHLLKEKNKL